MSKYSSSEGLEDLNQGPTDVVLFWTVHAWAWMPRVFSSVCRGRRGSRPRPQPVVRTAHPSPNRFLSVLGPGPSPCSHPFVTTGHWRLPPPPVLGPHSGQEGRKSDTQELPQEVWAAVPPEAGASSAPLPAGGPRVRFTKRH